MLLRHAPVVQQKQSHVCVGAALNLIRGRWYVQGFECSVEEREEVFGIDHPLEDLMPAPESLVGVPPLLARLRPCRDLVSVLTVGALLREIQILGSPLEKQCHPCFSISGGAHSREFQSETPEPSACLSFGSFRYMRTNVALEMHKTALRTCARPTLFEGCMHARTAVAHHHRGCWEALKEGTPCGL